MKNYLIFARLFVLSLLLGTTLNLSAQVSEGSQIIRLKAGGSFLGTIVEHRIEGYQIALITGDTIFLKEKSVAGIIEQKKEYHFFPNGKFTPTKGKYFSFLINMAFGQTPNDFWSPFAFDVNPLTFSGGYRFNQQVELGVGVGIDLYTDYLPFLPVFAEARYYITEKPTSLFVGGKLGGSFLLNSNAGWFNGESSGGLLMQPIIGFKSASRRKAKFIFEVGLKIQHATFVRWQTTDKLKIYRYTIGAGWLF